MTITIKIDTGNAAFQDGFKAEEVARIVHEYVLPCIADGAKLRPVRDYNGNTVGSVKVTGK